MADIVGPTGQPLFPFNQKPQDLNADVKINTGSAVKAFEDLQKLLSNMMKGFGADWGDATNDALKKQERFYRAIGEKELERKAMLQRYRNEAISAIQAETEAAIAGLEERARVATMTHEQMEKEKTDITKKAEQDRKNINELTDKKIRQESGPLSKVQAVAGRIGGPIGGLVSGAANLLAEPEVAIPAAIIGAMLEIANKRAAFTKTGIQLAGAGLGTLGAGAQGTGAGFDSRLFAGLNRALSADEQRAIIGGMAGSRTMIGQASTGGGMDALRGNLGLFANILPDAAKEMELFTDATKSLGMSQKDISKTFFQTQKSAKDLGITQLDAVATQIEMQKALRNITNDGTVAASVLDNVGSFFHEIGKSETETQRMTLGVANAGANLSLSQMTGMLAFSRGIGPTSPAMQQALFGSGGTGGMLGANGSGVFGLMGEFFTKVGGQFKNPMERLFAADRLNKDFGLGIQTQDLPKFFDLSERLRNGGMSQKDFSKQVEDLSKAGKRLSVDGMDELINIVGPIKQMEDMFTNFWTKADELFTKFFGVHSSPKTDAAAKQNIARQNMS